VPGLWAFCDHPAPGIDRFVTYHTARPAGWPVRWRNFPASRLPSLRAQLDPVLAPFRHLPNSLDLQGAFAKLSRSGFAGQHLDETLRQI
jgi:hypothetical protein